jgi:hypothetical protein
MGLLTERILSRGLVRHPQRNAGEPVGLQDNHQYDAAVLELSLDQHSLAAARMEPIVDPPFDQVFVGSMSPFRAVAGWYAGWCQPRAGERRRRGGANVA